MSDTISDDTRMGSKPWYLQPRNLIIAGIALVVIVVAIWYFAMKNSVLSDGNKQEATLSAEYSNGAAYLSNCVIKTNQVANVASANAAAFDKVIKDAINSDTVKGQHVDLGTSTGRSSFLPILVQAYPQLQGQTDLFNQVVHTIVGCQDDFRKQQSVVLDNVRSFESWRTGSWAVRQFGSEFPNSNLKVNIPGVPVLHGQAALDKMGQPIVDATTSKSYNTGQQSTQGPFPGATPSN